MTSYSPGPTGSTTVTVTRYGPATMVRGQAQITTSTFDITDANIQPAFYTDLMRLPEGQRDRDAQIMFTTATLFATQRSTNAKGDRVAYNNKVYEVVDTREYRMGVLDHSEVLMVEVNRA